MKGSIKTKPYFSAYPLKALNLSSTSQSNNNKGNIQTKRVIGRLRVLPMINPYSEKKISINKIKLPLNILPADDKWYNNYE